MIRDMSKYEEQGKKRIASDNWKRDLCVAETKQIAGAGDVFKVVSMAFYAGVEVGARLKNR